MRGREGGMRGREGGRDEREGGREGEGMRGGREGEQREQITHTEHIATKHNSPYSPDEYKHTSTHH